MQSSGISQLEPFDQVLDHCKSNIYEFVNQVDATMGEHSLKVSLLILLKSE